MKFTRNYVIHYSVWNDARYPIKGTFKNAHKTLHADIYKHNTITIFMQVLQQVYVACYNF